MDGRWEEKLGTVHQGDCIAEMEQLPDDAVHLAFADPPFNIGYKYDQYDDRLESERYLDWSREWISQVHRVLRDDGSFWLAIGDEYAAELKVLAQQVGFHSRSWVVWYYTFGVHCKAKFTRSHAHLFYFVKSADRFTFNADAIAVPSARQLVYGDRRANPKGRMPDDTWILRPQDCVEAFTPDEDLWYFPRVAGTFKERAGFHGCQMPEQLLGRIIKSCSNAGEVVLDPFGGSCTTLTVAKKLGRRFLGFELSNEYVKLGRLRIDAVEDGDALEGAEEPTVSAPGTHSSKARRLDRAAASASSFEQPLLDFESLAGETEGIIEAFARANRGYSVDRLVADPILNETFQRQCDRNSVPGAPAERNRFLFRLRKQGRLKQAGIITSERTTLTWDQMERYVFAAEIAWRQIGDLYAGVSLDEILCDPAMADAFDSFARRFSPGFTSLEYRWAALKLRKEGSKGRDRASRCSTEQLGIRKFTAAEFCALTEVSPAKIHHGSGIYAIRDARGRYLYAGESADLGSRLSAQLSDEARMSWPVAPVVSEPLELVMIPVSSVTDARLARQSWLLRWYRPEWNLNDQLAA